MQAEIKFEVISRKFKGNNILFSITITNFLFVFSGIVNVLKFLYQPNCNDFVWYYKNWFLKNIHQYHVDDLLNDDPVPTWDLLYVDFYFILSSICWTDCSIYFIWRRCEYFVYEDTEINILFNSENTQFWSRNFETVHIMFGFSHAIQNLYANLYDTKQTLFINATKMCWNQRY